MNLYESELYKQDLRDSLKAVPCVEELKNSSVMITGAAGLIGSYIADMLLTFNRESCGNAKIYALGRSLERLEKRFEKGNDGSLVYVRQDVNQPFLCDFPVDYIIHGAGNAYPAAFNNDPVGTVMSNVAGTKNILDYGRTHGAKRVLYVSSGEVYGQGDISLESFREDYGGYVDSTQPRSCYPNGKRTAETLCVSYTKQYGLDTVIARPCHTYGPNATSADNRANVQFVNNVLNGEDIVMKSPGSQMRSYCYIGDCGSAMLTVLLKGKSCEAYNIANPEARITIAGFAGEVAEASGRKLVFENPDAVALAERTPIAKQVLNSEKLEGLGWQGSYTVKEGVAHTLKILTDGKI